MSLWSQLTKGLKKCNNHLTVHVPNNTISLSSRRDSITRRKLHEKYAPCNHDRSPSMIMTCLLWCIPNHSPSPRDKGKHTPKNTKTSKRKCHDISTRKYLKWNLTRLPWYKDAIRGDHHILVNFSNHSSVQMMKKMRFYYVDFIFYVLLYILPYVWLNKIHQIFKINSRKVRRYFHFLKTTQPNV